ncbi:hypothetical protein [Mycobacteroides abscessus]|uniref:hypothetical protein n=1 Tax=Mycobacteroides abscessus TaxID=36809 RepID=UPI0019257A70|nr:hypothetical protein [Mycobacteroides abscessus]MBL3753003.1 hypothetical protein [Mycobacteroides abscessus subsp. massiliense]
MSAIPNLKHFQVLPEDRERVGGEGAVLLALVRFVTGLDYPMNEHRITYDGTVWWKASHAAIARTMRGTTVRKVGELVRKLEESGELESLLPDIWRGDQTKAYRIPPDQPEYEFASVPTSQNTNSYGTTTVSYRTTTKRYGTTTDSYFVLPIQEEKEVQEEKEDSWHPAENDEPEAAVNQGDPFAPSQDDGADEEDPDDWESRLRNGHTSDLFDVKARKTEAPALALAALPAVVDVETVPEEPRPQCTTPSCGRVATDDPKFFKYQICGKCAAYADLNKDLERLPVLRGGAA